MEYKFTPDRENYEMYASGGVLYSAPGHTAFPVRLATEIFRRCLALRAHQGESDRCVLYDPCCGSAYQLTTMAYFNWHSIERIIGSDIDADALSVAARNLSLLDLNGLDRRINEISTLYQQFGKASHSIALKNALELKQRLSELIASHKIDTQLFRADVTDRQAVSAELAEAPVDVVMADIPYGQHSNWDAATAALVSATDPVHQLLESLLPVMRPNAVVAVAAAKKDKIRHEQYQKLERFTVGKRQIVILRPNL